MSARRRCRGTRGGAAPWRATARSRGENAVNARMSSPASYRYLAAARTLRCEIRVVHGAATWAARLPKRVPFLACSSRSGRSSWCSQLRAMHGAVGRNSWTTVGGITTWPRRSKVSSADGGQPAPDEEHLRARREAARDHRFARISSIAADQGELLHAKVDWYGTYQHCGGRNLCQPRPGSVGQGRARHFPHSRRPAGRLEPRYRATGARTGADGRHHIRSG